MGIRENTIGVASVGCSAFTYLYFNFDFTQAPHGRAPAMATGIKRTLPDKIVITYQGDGDLASIGMGEIAAAAARGENISVFFLNNAIYGMTGGQMAPTTLPGQKTSSSQSGRDVETTGYPIRTSEMLATLDGAGYVVRRSLHSPKEIRRAKKAIRMALKPKYAASASRWSKCFPPAPPTGGNSNRCDGLDRGQYAVLLPAWRLQSPPGPGDVKI